MRRLLALGAATVLVVLTACSGPSTQAPPAASDPPSTVELPADRVVGTPVDTPVDDDADRVGDHDTSGDPVGGAAPQPGPVAQRQPAGAPAESDLGGGPDDQDVQR